MKVKLIKTVLVLLLSALCTQIDAQTVIKETVKIKPDAVSLKKMSTNSEVDWDRLLNPNGAFPMRYLTIPDDAPYSVVHYKSDLWYDFNYYWTYNTVEVLQGSQYVRFHLAPGVISGITETYDGVVTFKDPGDSFSTESPFWASFDEEIPPEIGASVQIRMNDDAGSIIFYFHLEPPSICRLVGSVYPERVVPYQKNWINIWPKDCNDLLGDITYNIEIVSGTQYGNLYDEATGLSGKKISNIYRPMGESNGFCFLPGNFIALEKDSVVIDFTCSEPNVKKGRIILPIMPQTLSVSIFPPSLKAGETGSFIIKKINADGSLSNLPSDTFFDVTILHCKDYGTIYVPAWNDTTDLARYIPLGFQFIARQEITDSLVSAIILVETAQQVGDVKIATLNVDSRIANLKTGMSTNFSIRGNNNTNEFEYLWGVGVVNIETSDDCSFAPKCNEQLPALTFEIKENTNNFAGKDWCKIAQENAKKKYGMDANVLEIFSSVENKKDFYQPIVLSKCFNSVKKYWQFDIKPIEINTVLTICPDNIPANRRGKEIYHDTPFCDYPKGALLKILQDLQGKQGYPSKNYNGYFFVDLDLDHEHLHKQDYESLVKTSLPIIQKVVDGYKPKCKETDVETKIKIKLSDKLGKIFNDIDGQWKKKKNSMDYEAKTQRSLKAKITSLILSINSCPNMRAK